MIAITSTIVALKVRTQTSQTVLVRPTSIVKPLFASIAILCSDCKQNQKTCFYYFHFRWCLLLICHCGATKQPTTTPTTLPIFPIALFIIINNDNSTTSILLPLL
jgi:hypothetical protein